METLEAYLRETWKPKQTDKEWLFQWFRILDVGGLWVDPKGYIFKKTDQGTLELQILAGTCKDRRIMPVHDVYETLIMTKIIGEELGITVKLETQTPVTYDTFSSLISNLRRRTSSHCHLWLIGVETTTSPCEFEENSAL